MSTTHAAPSTPAQAPQPNALASIPLSAITVKDGLNPRGQVLEDSELQALAETIRQRGCLQPIRVRADGQDRYTLIAGERRYRAAQLAGLSEIPASIAAHKDDQDGELELLTDAVIENELRRELDPLQRAKGYQAMIDAGLTVRGVAERLGGGAGRRSRESRVKEHLAILELPEPLREQVADGEIPLLAVKSLVALAEIHPQLASAAVSAAKPQHEHEEPYSWSEIVQSPLQIAIGLCDPLPPGVYPTRQRYPLEQFKLGEKAEQDLAALEQLTGERPQEIAFTREQVEQAQALGAVRDAGWFQVILGEDIAARLVEDGIATALSDARTRVTEAHADPVHASPQAVGEPQAAGEEKKRERERDRQQREHASAFNLELGVLAYKHLMKVKVDERVLRILASVDLTANLRGIATRGARLCLPGWPAQSEHNNGRSRISYLDPHETIEKALEFLQGAQNASEIAGRAITLIALAAYADETAIAQSRRSFYELVFRGPWSEQAKEDLRAILRERVKQGTLPALDEQLTEKGPGSGVKRTPSGARG